MSEMRVRVKICGLSTPQAVSAALDGGAAFIGFVFFAASPRNITPEAAARLAEPARNRAKVVAVTVDADDELLERLARVLAPDFIQLHGKEPPNRTREVAERTGAGVIRALPVSEARDLDKAAAFAGAADHLMFDARPPRDSDLPGGVGARFDWTLPMGRKFARPWFLAGGLDPWNVTEAVRLSGAPMVDVSSGVERGPGLKDPALIAAFLDAVRRA
jgi:phosphoribosylanthranilate isomerase